MGLLINIPENPLRELLLAVLTPLGSTSLNSLRFKREILLLDDTTLPLT